jgi:hypothetical protein
MRFITSADFTPNIENIQAKSLRQKGIAKYSQCLLFLVVPV